MKEYWANLASKQAATGALANMDVRGLNNRSLGEEWKTQLETYLGISMEGYPNLLMLSAPQSPFANLPIVLDNTATWIYTALKFAQDHGHTRMEPTKEAVDKWCKMLTDVYEGTVLPEAATKVSEYDLIHLLEGTLSDLKFSGRIVVQYDTPIHKITLEMHLLTAESSRSQRARKASRSPVLVWRRGELL